MSVSSCRYDIFDVVVTILDTNYALITKIMLIDLDTTQISLKQMLLFSVSMTGKGHKCMLK